MRTPYLDALRRVLVISSSALDIVHRFRNEFGMTLRNELFDPSQIKKAPKNGAL
ncbi:MAG: hypothetical protein J5930_05670 [Treponema sp.]|nr:hypothetical protein [Treponema sp.]